MMEMLSLHDGMSVLSDSCLENVDVVVVVDVERRDRELSCCDG